MSFKNQIIPQLLPPMKTNIGNSILASSSPEIFQPLPYKGGKLVVIEQREKDTHALNYCQGGQTITLARHPNGFSCHSLAKRIVGGDVQRIREQAKYIVACGGWASLSALP